MAVASLELQKALFAALSSSTYKVYEIVPPNTIPPYITIGEETLTSNNTKTNTRTNHTVTIHTWAKGSSSSGSKILNDFVLRTVLNGLTVNGFSVDSINLEMLTSFKELDETTSSTLFHGVLQFEITLTLEV